MAPALPTPDPVPPGIGERELEKLRSPGWRYPWRIAPGIVANCSDPGARRLAASQLEMLAPHVRELFAATPNGYRRMVVAGAADKPFAHAAFDWGAEHVTCLEADDDSARRSELIGRLRGLPRERLEIRVEADLDAFVTGAETRFAVAFLAGIVGPVDEPTALARTAKASASGLAILELSGEPEAQLEEALGAAGMTRWGRLTPPADSDPRMVLGKRSLLLASPGSNS